MNQYCYLHLNDINVADGLLDLMDRDDLCMDSSDGFGVEKRIADILAAHLPNGSAYLRTVDATDRPALLGALSVMNIQPHPDDDHLLVGFEGLSRTWRAIDAAPLDRTAVRGHVEAYFLTAGVADIRFVTQPQFNELTTRAFAPLAGVIETAVNERHGRGGLFASVLFELNQLGLDAEIASSMLARVSDSAIDAARLVPKQGPVLNGPDLSSVRAVCERPTPSVRDCLDALAALVPVLVELDGRLQDGISMDVENIDPFRDVVTSRTDLLDDPRLGSFLQRHFRDALDTIAADGHLGSIIARFDYALLFVEMLDVNDELEEFIVEGVVDQAGLDAWAHIAVIHAFHQDLQESEDG